MTKLLAILFAAVIFTNPLTNQYIVQAMETGMYYITFLAPHTIVAFLVLCIFYAGTEYAKSEKLTVPKKKAKTQKAGEFIEY